MQGGQGGTRSADSRYRTTAADATEDFLFHLYRGSELLQDNRVHEAKEELEQALKLQPRDAKGQDLLAVVYFRLGLYPRAIEIYEELTQAFPTEPTLCQNLGVCYLKTGQADKARTLLERLIVAHPNASRGWGYLGLAFERLGDLEKARAAFERAAQPGMVRRIEDRLAGRVPNGGDDLSAFSEVDAGAPEPALEPKARRPSLAPSAFAAQPAAVPAEPPPPVPPPPAPPAVPSLRPILPSVAQLSGQNGLSFPREPGAVLDPSGLVLVQVENTFAARATALHAMCTDTQGFRSSLVQRKARGRLLDEPLGGREHPILLFSGWGYLALSPREHHRLVALKLDDEALYLREDALVGFEGSLSFENGRLASQDGQHVPLVQVRGRGSVVFEARHALACLDVTGDMAAILPDAVIVGWTGRLLPRELPPEEAPRGATHLFSFAGDGTVFVATATIRPSNE